MDGFQKCTLKRNEDGDPDEFFAKKTGFGVDDMCVATSNLGRSINNGYTDVQSCKP